MTVQELLKKSWSLRRNVVDIIMAGGGGHIGGDMSVLNALLVLYKNHLNISRKQRLTRTATALCSQKDTRWKHCTRCFRTAGFSTLRT